MGYEGASPSASITLHPTRRHCRQRIAVLGPRKAVLDEFNLVFAALFDHHERHLKVIRALEYERPCRPSNIRARLRRARYGAGHRRLYRRRRLPRCQVCRSASGRPEILHYKEPGDMFRSQPHHLAHAQTGGIGPCKTATFTRIPTATHVHRPCSAH